MKRIRILNGDKPIFVSKCGFDNAGQFKCFVVRDAKNAGLFADEDASIAVREIKRAYPGATLVLAEPVGKKNPIKRARKKTVTKKRATRVQAKKKRARKRARKNPVPPSKIARAKSLYQNFTGHTAESIDRVKIPNITEAIAVGEMDGIMYSTVRDGELEHYIHKFKKRARPTLAVSGDGKNILILGGKFEFTDRGFIDK